jgi:RNA polymerase sigma-70 factor (ECF subfamily)
MLLLEPLILGRFRLYLAVGKVQPNIPGLPVNYSAQDDFALLKLVTEAHTDALGELYNRYGRLLFSIAFTIIGDRATAEEVTLEVFTRVWQKAATYQPEQAKVSTWLTTITRNHAIDILRRQSVRPEHNSVSWDEILASPLLVRNEVENSPEYTAELSLQRLRVHAAVAQLPNDQKQALVLAYFRGYTHHQIAEVLDQPLGTIKTRIRMALQKLRQLLQEEQVTK